MEQLRALGKKGFACDWVTVVNGVEVRIRQNTADVPYFNGAFAGANRAIEQIVGHPVDWDMDETSMRIEEPQYY